MTTLNHPLPNSFIVAFAGKRILPQSMPAISTLIQKFLDVFIGNTAYNELIMLNGLAEGADALAAEAWLASPVPPQRRLYAVIPMPEQRYEQSLATETDRKRFRQLWEQAHLHTALDTTGDPDPNAPYIAQSDYLVAHGHRLLAIADTSAERKPGGTLDTIHKFMAANKPVACYDYMKGGWMVFRGDEKEHSPHTLLFQTNI